MMDFFKNMFSMGANASIVILFIITVRLILRKAPKKYSYILWAIPLVRLLIPFSFESIFCLIPKRTYNSVMDTAEVISSAINTPKIPVDTGTANGAFYHPQNVQMELNHEISPSASLIQVNHTDLLAYVLLFVWLTGIAVMLLYSVVSFIRVKRKIIGAVPLKDNIYLADHIPTPFVLGLFKPKIYLPSYIRDCERAYIIKHEQVHIRRFDHITRIIAFAALCVHWYNPLVWAAFILSGKDMEMSCDEAVIVNSKSDIRADYSQSLLNFSVKRKYISVSPLAFGVGDTKERVKNIMTYKKPAVWIIIITVIVMCALIIGLLSNPISSERNVDSDIERSLTYAILDQNDSHCRDGILCMDNDNEYSFFRLFPFEAHKILGVKRNGNNTTVYAVIMYEDYKMLKDNSLEVEPYNETSVFMPIAVTFITTADGNKLLSEYWEPYEGLRYADSVNEKFPKDMAKLAVAYKSYEQELRIDIEKQKEYYNTVKDSPATQMYLMKKRFDNDYSQNFEAIFDPESAYLYPPFIEYGETVIGNHYLYRVAYNNPSCPTTQRVSIESDGKLVREYTQDIDYTTLYTGVYPDDELTFEEMEEFKNNFEKSAYLYMALVEKVTEVYYIKDSSVIVRAYSDSKDYGDVKQYGDSLEKFVNFYNRLQASYDASGGEESDPSVGV